MMNVEILRIVALTGVLLLAAGALPAEQAKNRAAWMAEGSYGVMVHYLITPRGDTPEARAADFNRTIDGFDVKRFLKQIDESGADWLIFTIGQNTSCYNSPNAFLDSRLPGHTPKRDLVLEIARGLHAQGKRFIAYLPAEVAAPADLHEVFAWSAEDKAEFHKRYTSFVRDYAVKLGKLCDGWWFDGCYPAPPFNAGGYPWEMWMQASRAGNPDAAVALNDGSFCTGRLTAVSPLQDYLSGEVHLLEDGKIRTDFVGGPPQKRSDRKVRGQGQEAVTYYMPASRTVQGVQWHALVPLFLPFNPAIPGNLLEYPDDDLFAFLRDVKAVEGAVTFNVPIANDGIIPGKPAAQLKRIGKFLRKNSPPR